MSRDSQKDLSTVGFIGLNCAGIKVVIFGGGRAAYLKALFFVSRGALVTVYSPEISADLTTLELTWQREVYRPNILDNFLLVVIATSNQEVNRQIKAECEKKLKLYLYAPKAKESQISTPIQGKSRFTNFALQCKIPNPKLAQKLRKVVAMEICKAEVRVVKVNWMATIGKSGKTKNSL